MRTIEEIKAEYNSVKSALPDGYINTDLCELEWELRQALQFDIPIERLEKICQAENENRLFTAPVPIGSPMYWIKTEQDDVAEYKPCEPFVKRSDGEIAGFVFTSDTLKILTPDGEIADIDNEYHWSKEQVETALEAKKRK